MEIHHLNLEITNIVQKWEINVASLFSSPEPLNHKNSSNLDIGEIPFDVTSAYAKNKPTIARYMGPSFRASKRPSVMSENRPSNFSDKRSLEERRPSVMTNYAANL